MRIAIVTEFCVPYFNGGGEIRYHEIAKRLVKKGHKVDLICCKFPNAPSSEKIDGVNVYHVGPTIKDPPKRSVLNFLHYIVSCFLFLLKKRYDIIDSNTYIPLLPSFFVSKIKGIPTVATINILIGDWSEDIYNPKIAAFVERFLFGLPFDKVLTVSNYAKRELSKNFKIKSSKIVVVHNGVDLDTVDAIKVKKSEDKTIIYVGRLIWYKYIEDLVEAVAILKKDFKDIKLKVVGDGMKMKLLKNKVKELNLKRNVEILGKKDYKQTIREIKRSTLLALPSTKDTFGMVLVEAGAAKKPVIAYNAGGPIDVVVDRKNGFLVEPRNVKDLANKIRKIVSNKKLARKMGENGRKIVEEKFTWDKVAENIEKIYKDVCIPAIKNEKT